MFMAVTLNRAGFDFAQELVKQAKVKYDERDAWSEDQPSPEKENEFIRTHGIHEYAKWHLGIDEAESENAKGRYKFPYGDFTVVHRCGVLSAESRAGQYKYFEVERAAAHLHGMIEAVKKAA
jgi:hypothetical protein